jgi:hypothetical protein
MTQHQLKPSFVVFRDLFKSLMKMATESPLGSKLTDEMAIGL